MVKLFVVSTMMALAGLAGSMPHVGHASGAIVPPPACENNRGEKVLFEIRPGNRAGLAAGMANRNAEGKPVVYRSGFEAAIPAFQKFIDRHECAHHQTGDVDRPHPPRNSPAHLYNEAVSDCVAILRLRDEEGFADGDLESVVTALSADMEKIGFPPISVTSRVSNIRNCFKRDGTARDLINQILSKRGLPVQ